MLFEDDDFEEYDIHDGEGDHSWCGCDLCECCEDCVHLDHCDGCGNYRMNPYRPSFAVRPEARPAPAEGKPVVKPKRNRILAAVVFGAVVLAVVTLYVIFG